MPLTLNGTKKNRTKRKRTENVKATEDLFKVEDCGFVLPEIQDALGFSSDLNALDNNDCPSSFVYEKNISIPTIILNINTAATILTLEHLILVRISLDTRKFFESVSTKEGFKLPHLD